MRPPLNNWGEVTRGYRNGDPTFYSPRHLGVDYLVPSGTPVFAPVAGAITTASNFPQGGNTVWFNFVATTGIVIMRLLHLSQMGAKGQYQEGDLIAYTGNTGQTTTGPHLHLDLSRNSVQLNNFSNFIDPDTFFAYIIPDESMKITDQTINDLYVAVYRRPADPAGRAYWIGREVMDFVKAAPQQAEWKVYTPLLQAGKLIEEFGRKNR